MFPRINAHVYSDAICSETNPETGRSLLDFNYASRERLFERGPFFSDIFYNTIIWSCKINTTGYFRFEKYFKSCSPFKIMDIQLNV